MDILLPYSWIKDYLKTNATPEKFAECLSLCGPTIDYSKKVGDDTVFQFDITHNRVDSASVMGIAREAEAILPRFGIKTTATEPKISPRRYVLKKNQPYLLVKITPPSLCPRFTAILLKNVKIAPSPLWMKDRLEKVGMRPLNNVVDISNYLMLETGQPMHTFDYDKIKGHKMLMRESKKDEKITTLDGAERVLKDGDIVIEDGDKRLIDLCGVMGGKLSEVDENTKNVLLFVQTYEPQHIRKTSLFLNHRTEAAILFEKNLDPEQVLPTLKRATDLFVDLAKAKTDGKVIDVYPQNPKVKKIRFDLKNISRLIGVEIKIKEVVSILNSLGFKTKKTKKDALDVTIPSWRRVDILEEADLVEEIARLYGYFKLPNVVPLNNFPLEEKDKGIVLERKLKEALSGIGLTEVITYSLVGEKLLKAVGDKKENYLKLANPMSEDSIFPRQSLIPSLLEVVLKNQNGFPQIRIFETARIYKPNNEGKRKGEGVEEHNVLGGLTNPGDYFKAKGVVELLMEKVGVKTSFTPLNDSSIFDPQRSARIESSGMEIGIVGEVRSDILARLTIKNTVSAFELNLDQLTSLFGAPKNFMSMSKYPPIVEDLTFKTEPERNYIEILERIKSVSPLISKIDLHDRFNEFRTIRITYQSFEKSLSDQEIKNVREKITSLLKDEFGAVVKEATTNPN